MYHNGQAQQNEVNEQQAEEQEKPLLENQLRQELEAEQHKSEEYLDLLRRTQADFVNYRRRIEQEQAAGSIAAQVAVLQKLLPVLDDLGRAIQATPAELRYQPWVQGLLLVGRRLNGTLEEMGVRQVGKEGEKFDPRWHEAVAMEARGDVPEETILHVAKPGYAMGDRIIRPAQVVVAGAVPSK